jgi:hypothetical protein
MNEAQKELLTQNGYKVDEYGGYFDSPRRKMRVSEWGGDQFVVDTTGGHWTDEEGPVVLQQLQEAVILVMQLKALGNS